MKKINRIANETNVEYILRIVKETPGATVSQIRGRMNKTKKNMKLIESSVQLSVTMNAMRKKGLVRNETNALGGKPFVWWAVAKDDEPIAVEPAQVESARLSLLSVMQQDCADLEFIGANLQTFLVGNATLRAVEAALQRVIGMLKERTGGE